MRSIDVLEWMDGCVAMHAKLAMLLVHDSFRCEDSWLSCATQKKLLEPKCWSYFPKNMDFYTG